MAWLGTWAKRKKITVDNTNIDSDLTQFPVPIVLGTSVGRSSQDLSEIFDDLGANSLKIAITKVDGTTEIYGDIEQWDDSGEKAVIHCAKSDLDITTAAVTELYVYWDATESDNTTYLSLSGGTAAQSVWDSDFQAVYHMAQDPSIGGACILDSTVNNNDGTPAGSMTSGDLVDGLIGKALDFDGTDDGIDCGNDSSLNIVDESTLEIQFQPASIYQGTDDEYINLINKGGAFASPLRRTLHIHNRLSTDAVRFSFHQESVGYVVEDLGPDIDWIGDWKSFSGTATDGATPLGYIDGSAISPTGSAAVTTCANNTLPLLIGDNDYVGTTNQPFHGKISEARVSKVVRSADWIKATNYALTDDLLTYGATEIGSGTTTTTTTTTSSSTTTVTGSTTTSSTFSTSSTTSSTFSSTTTNTQSSTSTSSTSSTTTNTLSSTTTLPAQLVHSTYIVV